nr:DUF1127 domain-containing protein [Ruegeria arenilitoris]
MAQTATKHAPLGAATILHVVNAFTTTFDEVIEWNKNRKTRKVLSGLTDAQLEDIGLERAEIAKI